MSDRIVWRDRNFPGRPDPADCVIVQDERGDLYLCYWIADVATFDDPQYGYITHWEAWAEIPRFTRITAD